MTSITVYSFAKPDNASGPSGYCQKLETFFRACPSIANSYTQSFVLPSSAPKAKLPYVSIIAPEVSAKPMTVADSHFIIKFLVETKIAPDLDAALSPSQRAESRAFQAWTEETMYPSLVVTRFFPAWGHNYQKFYDGFDQAPWFLKPIVLWRMRSLVTKALVAQGTGRHEKAEIELSLKEWVNGVGSKLGDGEGWFHGGENYTEIDIIIASFLIQGLSMNCNQEFNQLVAEKKGLITYTSRVVKLWYPEYEPLQKKLERLL